MHRDRSPRSFLPRQAAPLWAAACLAGCYTYSRPATVEPEPARTFVFDLTDQGRAALAGGVGAGTDRIEGGLVTLTDSSFTVRVARVVDIRGGVAQWNGEAVSIRREYVGTVRERRLSRGRTAVAVGGVAAAVVALIASRGLGVFGNDPGGSPGEPPPGGETSLAFPLTLLMTLFTSR